MWAGEIASNWERWIERVGDLERQRVLCSLRASNLLWGDWRQRAHYSMWGVVRAGDLGCQARRATEMASH